MKNLGAKLKATRESMQLSLRDVADATRLRIFVLEKMEDGSFDYKLQDIYKRGFLRIYASFLKLDVDAIMREYNTAMAMRPSEDGKKRIAVAQFEEADVAQETNFGDLAQEQEVEPDMTMKYVKLGGAFVLAILLIIVVMTILSSVMKSGSEAPVQSQDNANVENVSAESAINDVPATEPVLVVSAYGDTYLTVAKNANRKSAIFTGTIKAGENKEFKMTEALYLLVTDASKIKMSRDGKVVYDKSASGVKAFEIMPK